jgi:hypothetical protein
MTLRFAAPAAGVLITTGVLIVMVAAPLSAQTPVAKAKTWTAPRASDGHPDLQGVWTNATITPMERPAALAGKPTLNEAEAKAYEAHDQQTNTLDESDSPLVANTGSGAVGAYNNLFVDRGSELARVDGAKRTSLIVDPPDGKIPFLPNRPAQMRAPGFGSYNSVKDRPLSERCILGFGSTAGPPMLPVLYNNNYQIVQTHDTLVILVEMVHDARVVRLNSTHAPSNIRRLFGDSIGHWEGDTLVVDTTNFTDQTRFRGSTENLHVIERFKRVDAQTILYRATIEDSAAYSKPWTLEYPFRATDGPVYEYACHEGNYAMPDILGGARKLESQEKNQEKK